MPGAVKEAVANEQVKAKLYKSWKTENGASHRRPSLSLIDEEDTHGSNSSSLFFLGGRSGVYCPLLFRIIDKPFIVCCHFITFLYL